MRKARAFAVFYVNDGLRQYIFFEAIIRLMPIAMHRSDPITFLISHSHYNKKSERVILFFNTIV